MDVSPLALPAPPVGGQALEEWANAATENEAGFGVISMITSSMCLFLPVRCLSALKALNLSCSLPICRRCRQWSQINPLTIFRTYMGVLWSQSFNHSLVGNTRDEEDPWGEMQTTPTQSEGRQRDLERNGSSFKGTSQLLKSWSLSQEESLYEILTWDICLWNGRKRLRNYHLTGGVFFPICCSDRVTG